MTDCLTTANIFTPAPPPPAVPVCPSATETLLAFEKDIREAHANRPIGLGLDADNAVAYVVARVRAIGAEWLGGHAGFPGAAFSAAERYAQAARDPAEQTNAGRLARDPAEAWQVQQAARIAPAARAVMVLEIAQAGGNEVSFTLPRCADGTYHNPVVFVRGSRSRTLAPPPCPTLEGAIVVHSHPSGVLEPSDPDFEAVKGYAGVPGLAFGIVDPEVSRLYVVCETPPVDLGGGAQ